MQKLILASVCVAALACPSAAQSPGQIFDAVHGLYREATGQPRQTTPVPHYVLSSPLAIVFLNPAAGSRVRSSFTVEGYTSPYNTVDVTLNRGRGGRQNQRSRSSVTADHSGRFVVAMDASQIQKQQQMAVHAQASDSRGNQGPIQALMLVRR